MIKVVFLDVDNTLLDFNACANWAIQMAAEEAKISFSDGLCREFHRVNNQLWKHVETGEYTKEYIFSIRWDKIFAEFGIRYDGVKFESIFHRYVSLSHQKVDFAEELLQYLSPKYLLCAASNAHHKEQCVRLESAGLLSYFQHVFTSQSVDAPKPGKAFFDACFSQLDGVQPHEAVMIGDSPSADISGGTDYGMQTVWFNFENKECPADCHPTYTVDSLSEICNIL